MIVVTGATGQSGQEVVRELVSSGKHVAALVRNRQKGELLFNGTNVELRVGDFSDPASLESGFAGAERVYLLETIDQRQIEWNAAAVAAAKKAGVKQLVRLSGIHASSDSPSEMLRMHAVCDDQIAMSGIAYVILRPNSFYQNLFFSQTTIRGMGKIFLPLGDCRQSLLDVRDVAACAAHVLSEPIEAHRDRIYVLTGERALTYYEVAEKLSRAIEKPVEYDAITPAKALEMMLTYGVPEWNARAVVEFREFIATGACAIVTEDVRRLLGRAPRTLDAFCDEFYAIFLSAKEVKAMKEKKELAKMTTTTTTTTNDTSDKSASDYFTELRALLEAEPHRCNGVTGVWQFKLSGAKGGDYFVEISGGKARVVQGEAPAPGVTIAMTCEDYISMASGKVPGTELFMTGRMRVTGDPMLGMRAEALFT